MQNFRAVFLFQLVFASGLSAFGKMPLRCENYQVSAQDTNSILKSSVQLHLIKPSRSGLVQSDQSLNFSDARSKEAHRSFWIDAGATSTCQTIRGFGFAITESTVINAGKLSLSERSEMMRRLFDTDAGAGFSYLILPLSSNDFSDPAQSDFSVCDCWKENVPANKNCLSTSRLEGQIQFALEAKKLNPNVKLMLKPWTTPPFMKFGARGQSNHYNGGDFNPRFSLELAQCLAAATQYIEGRGLKVQSVSVQNEPGLALKYPSVRIAPTAMAKVLEALSKELNDLGLNPQLILRADNWNAAGEAYKTLQAFANRPEGMIFAGHCYSNDPESSRILMGKDEIRFCGKNKQDLEYMMGECTGGGPINPGGDFAWWFGQRVIDDIDLGASASLAWNGLLDEKGGPINHGYCKHCRGLMNINFASHRHLLTDTPELAALALAAKALQPGSRHMVAQTSAGAPKSVVAINPDGSHSVLLQNFSRTESSVSIYDEVCRKAIVTMPPGSGASVRW